MEIKIRKLDPVVIKVIDEIAKGKKMSREEYLRNYISQIAILEETKKIESQYVNLVQILSERLEQANDIIARNNYLFEQLIGKEGL